MEENQDLKDLIKNLFNEKEEKEDQEDRATTAIVSVADGNGPQGADFEKNYNSGKGITDNVTFGLADSTFKMRLWRSEDGSKELISMEKINNSNSKVEDEVEDEVEEEKEDLLMQLLSAYTRNDKETGLKIMRNIVKSFE